MELGLVRIGDKVIDREKLWRNLEQILHLRASGLPQQEVAERLGVDRSFISRLEALGEVRKGRRVAVVGFPIANKEELERVCQQAGAELVLILRNAERWQYVRERDGVQLVNDLMQMMARLREFDAVVFLGSDMRIQLASGLLQERLLPVQLGPSPLKQDYWVDPAYLASLLEAVMTGDPALVGRAVRPASAVHPVEDGAQPRNDTGQAPTMPAPAGR